MVLHIWLYSLSWNVTEFLESENKEYYGTITFGKVSQYGIFKGKLFAEMIIAEQSQATENRKITWLFKNTG